MAYYHLTSDDEVVLFITDGKHEHEDKPERGIPAEIKEQIKRYFEMKITTPKAILRALEHDGIQRPQIKTLSNYLATIRKAKYGPAQINVSDLEQWHQNRKEVPDDYDKPFCPSFEKGVDNHQLMFFRIFITTKRLIINADKTKHLTVDATYKLIWQGFPVLMIGTTDRQKHFHPFGICISTNETGDDFRFLFESLKKVVFDVMQLQFSPNIVIADGADAITNGFQEVFDDIFELRVMCFAHVIRKVDVQLNRFTTDAQKAIK